MATAKKKEKNDMQEEVLQGIVIADSFNSRFAPLTQRLPRTLLPVANMALLDYTIEFLANAGVKDIHVFCCAFSADIEAHVNGSRWKVDPTLSISTIKSQSCTSMGEALREIYQMGFIRSHFVLIGGDTIANFNVESVLETHKQRCKEDKEAIMTMFFKEVDPGHHLRCKEEDLAVTLDKTDRRLVGYDRKVSSKLPMKSLIGRSAIEHRYNLLDCHLYLCSPEVLGLFSDNFDYQSMEDLIHGVLQGDEIQDHKIHTHVLSKEYAVRVSNLSMYSAVSNDILNRWTFPLVPDLFTDNAVRSNVKYKRNHIYLEGKVTLSRTCELVKNVLVGESSRIGVDNGKATRISNSVIGRNCVIGADVELEDVFVWDNVTIGNGCKLKKAIIASGAVLKDNVEIVNDVIVGHEVVLGPDLSVPSHSRYVIQMDEDDDVQFDKEVGREGKGFRMDVDNENPDYDYLIWENGDPESILESGSEESQDDDDDDDDEDGLQTQESLQETDPYNAFYDEVLDVVRERVRLAKTLNKEVLSNVALEVTGSRSAHHMSPEESARAICHAIIATGPGDLDYLKKAFACLASILSNYCKSLALQSELIGYLEEAVMQHPQAQGAFPHILHVLYNNDALEESCIHKWYKAAEGASGVRGALRDRTSALVKWLLEAEEEDSEEEDDDSEEE